MNIIGAMNFANAVSAKNTAVTLKECEQLRSFNAELLYALRLLMCWTMRDGSPCCCPAGKSEGDSDQPTKMPTFHASGCSDARAVIAKVEKDEKEGKL